jgi:exopolysaccharide biosynthesis polyprenyl glycosylphosphotransferase
MEARTQTIEPFGLSTPPEVRNKPHSLMFGDWIFCAVIVGDFIALVCALSLAFLEREYFSFGLTPREFRPSDYLPSLFWGTLLFLILLQFNGAYQKHRFLHRFYILNVAAKTSAMWALAFLAITIGLETQSSISRLFVFWSLINSLIFVFGWRMFFRQILYTGNWAALLRDRVLVVGWSKESDALSKQIAQDAGHPYQIIGCTPSAHGKFWVRPPTHISVLGDYNGLRELLHGYQPDILILADLDPVMGELVALAQLCIKENVQFKVIPSFFQVFVSGLNLESISGVPLIGINKLPLDRMHNRLLKQLVDIVGASVGLLLSAPLILIFGLLIYRESPGPIFYSQIRSGRGGRLFKIHKLRSMRLNAESNGPQWTKENDPRRLKIGELMRKTNIDEVPQFWNVLKGEMSLVGPRPERPELIANFKEEITHYNARHHAKPGITGYAQVNGMRGNTDLTERVRYDLYYLENWSLSLDFQIMLKTFFVRTNAY